MNPHLDAPCCARLPLPALAALADLRRVPGIVVTTVGEHAWVRWGPGDEAVLRRVMPLPGSELYTRRDGLWYRIGAHLPAFGLPVEDEDRGVPLDRAVVPDRVEALAPDVRAPVKARLGLVRDDRARGSSALLCELGALARWADSATTAQFGPLTAAWSGDEVLVRGEKLPAVAAGTRFWGVLVLVPLGFRPEPDLPEAALRGALGTGEEALLVLSDEGGEEVPLAAFRPLTRAGVRLAREGRQP